MKPELRQFIEQARLCHAAVRRVPELLPADDAALDSLVAETVGDNDLKAFMRVVVAAASRGGAWTLVGARRLKATPNVMRQRIGSDYQRLFRLWPERLEVIDLINRKDLERRIKTLV